MHIVFGGAFQGKLDYCINAFDVIDDDVQTFSQELTSIDASKNVYNQCHELVMSLVKRNENPVEFFKEHLKIFNDKILIFDETSCGIVPVDATVRKAREENGRVLVLLCEQAQHVTRVFCGIPTRVK